MPGRTRSCVGESAARTLRHPAIDTAFISASGWDSRGIFTPDENKVTVKETVSQVSARSILLCDSSKYNQVATFMALPLTRFTTIITDRHLSDAAASHIARHACRCCGPDNARGHRRVSVASARSAPRRSRRFADFARPCSPAYPADKSPQCALLCYSGQAGATMPRAPRSPAPVLSAINQLRRRSTERDQRSGDPIVHHPLQQLPLRTGAQTLAGQQLAQGRGHAGRGSGVAGVAGKRLIPVPFPSGQGG